MQHSDNWQGLDRYLTVAEVAALTEQSSEFAACRTNIFHVAAPNSVFLFRDISVFFLISIQILL